MSWEKPLEQISLIAGEDLSAAQYYAVKLNSSGRVVKAGAGENAIGIVQDAPKLGQVAAVMTLGVSFAVYGGSVTAGQNLAVDANGKLVPASGNAAVVAVALESGSANEIHSVLLVTRTSTGTNSGCILAIPLNLANIAADGNVVNGFVPGINGVIKKVSFVFSSEAGAGTNAAVDLSLKINATAVTGGVVSLAVANSALGTVVDGSPVTGNNVFDSDDSITVVADVTTAFTAGAGVLLIVVQ